MPLFQRVSTRRALADVSRKRLASIPGSVTLGLAAFLPLASYAQAPPASVEAGIQEVLVTARRREENLQEVPIAISSISADALERRDINNLQDLSGIVPNVKIGGSAFGGNSGGTYRMRGIPGVEVYQDGVSLTASGGALPHVIDVERVEVLRGPQGTLFGRNAIGGAIQIVTKKPSADFSGSVDTTFGSFGRVDVTGSVNFPVTGNFFAKLTGSSLNRDGFVRSTKVNTHFGSQGDDLMRADFLWQPLDRLEARLQYTRTNNSSNGSPYVTFKFDAVCPGDPLPSQYLTRDGRPVFTPPNVICILQNAPIDYSRVSGTNAREFQSYGLREEYVNTVDDASLYAWWQETDDVKLDLTYELTDTWMIRSITSRRWGKGTSPSSLDGTGIEFAYRPADNVSYNDTRTTELQVLYSGDRWSGTTGIFYERIPGRLSRAFPWLNTELLRPGIQAPVEAWLGYPVSQLNLTSRPTLLGNATAVSNSAESTQRAAFAEWTLNATDKLRLTAGIRYTKQERVTTSYGANQVVNAQPPCCHLDASVNYLAVTGVPRELPTEFEQYTPRASVQYQWTPDFMTYFTYSKGATTGGVNNPPLALTGLQPYPFLPQVVKNYEFGIRSDLFNGRLRLNASLFHDDFTDIQVSEEIYPGIGVQNNADGRIQGIEIEGIWAVTPDFTVNYGYGYLDSEYTALGTTQLLELGTPFSFAPKYSVDVGAEYVWRRASGSRISLRGDYTAQDDTVNVVDRFNQGLIPGFKLVSSRLKYEPAEGNWDLSLSGTNLTKEYYWTSIFAPPGGQYTGGSLGRPREWALNFNVRFD